MGTVESSQPLSSPKPMSDMKCSLLILKQVDSNKEHLASDFNCTKIAT